jgi:hypothetical protein
MENGNSQTLGVGKGLLFALEEDGPEVRVGDVNAGNRPRHRLSMQCKQVKFT